MAKENSDKNNAYALFLNFFAKWTVLGLLIILFAFLIKFEIIPLLTNSPKAVYLIQVLHYMFYSIGISLIIASFFSFSIEAGAFISYIEKLLRKIIISKDFLSDLEFKNKKEALNLLLQPSDYQLKLYSNVNEYFQEYIDSSLKFFDTNFRSNMNFKITVKYSEDKSKIKITSSMSYRIYKAKEGYEPIKIGYDKDSEVEEFFCEITNPDGLRIEEANSKGTLIKEESGIEWIEHKYEIPKEHNMSPYISVFRKLVSYSKKNFEIICFKAMEPIDGIVVDLTCHSDLIIKDYMIFDDDKKYTTDLNKDKKTLAIIGNHWLRKRSGFYIFITKDN
jgi:hypothetical protein